MLAPGDGARSLYVQLHRRARLRAQLERLGAYGWRATWIACAFAGGFALGVLR